MSVEVTYYLTAEVDGVEVFHSSYPDTTMLQEELYKAEHAVEAELESLEDDE
jgi:hypothetical protein